MKPLNLKLIILFILLLVCLKFNSSAQTPPDGNPSEKMEQFKKMKMLDYLNLSDDNSEKFLMKYSSVTRKIKEKNRQIDEATRQLNIALKSKKKDEINNKTEDLVRLQQEMLDLLKDSQQQIRGVLSDIEFAKYLIFERNFNRELRKMVQNRIKEKHKN